MPTEFRRWSSFSATNASQVGAKLAYLKLNTQTACPPRAAVPVNTGARFRESVSPQHARFAFGDGCDRPSYFAAYLPDSKVAVNRNGVSYHLVYVTTEGG